jgi:hypothetical protein
MYTKAWQTYVWRSCEKISEICSETRIRNQPSRYKEL